MVWAGLPYPSTVVSGQEVCRRLFLEGLYVFGTATSLLFRADLVRSRECFYNEANVHSDLETCIALLASSNFGFVHQVLTFTRVRENSRITMSRDINTVAASNLHHLVTYGQAALSEPRSEFLKTSSEPEPGRILRLVSGGQSVARSRQEFLGIPQKDTQGRWYRI